MVKRNTALMKFACYPFHRRPDAERSVRQQWNMPRKQLTCVIIAAVAFSAICRSEEPVFIEPELNLMSAFQTKYFFRGVPTLGNAPVFSSELTASTLGWSADVSLATSLKNGNTQISGFLDYSYGIGIADLSAGVNGRWDTAAIGPNTVELNFKIQGHAILWGIAPSLVQYFRISGGGIGYGEIELSRPTLVRQGVEVIPYAVFGYGDYYSSSYTANHFQTGVDVYYRLTKECSLDVFGAVVVPFRGAQAVNRDASTDGYFGLGLRVHF